MVGAGAELFDRAGPVLLLGGDAGELRCTHCPIVTQPRAPRIWSLRMHAGDPDPVRDPETLVRPSARSKNDREKPEVRDDAPPITN